MWHRFVVALVVVLGFGVVPALAQQTGVYSKATPPDKAVLDRLKLKTEWVQYIPVEGNRDTLTQVQTIDDQIFVQTRAGLFLAIDAITGRIQWAARLGNGSYGNSYPVAANSTFVFVSHVTKLYAFYRYTGLAEFMVELGTPPTVGLACDESAVFCVLGVRPGSAGAHRVAVYDLPKPIEVREPVKGPADLLARGAKAEAVTPVDELLKRYPPGTVKPGQPEPFEPLYRPDVMQAPVGVTTGSKTPSISTLHRVSPPYTLGNRASTPSIMPLPTLRQPYHIRHEAGRLIQQTPSIGVIPPSMAAALALSDLRPKGITPPLRWEYGLTARILYPITLTPLRAWVVTEGNMVLALSKNSEPTHVITEVKDRLTTAIAAAPSQSGLTNYLPMGNGTLVSVEATGGTLEGGVPIKWRAEAGGLNNRSPVILKDFVFASGDDSGVTCVKRDDGDVIWRSDANIDRIIGGNEEFVYLRDRQGRFLVFDAKRPTDPARRKSAPLGSANLNEFNINVVNTVSDRVYLAADNGLLVCLRDSAPKYTKPMRMWPPPVVNQVKKVVVEAVPAKDDMNPAPPPKKEPQPKKDAEPKM